MVIAVLAAAGALGLGGRVGGLAAAVASLVVPGYAVLPDLGRDDRGTRWLLRVVLSTALVALAFLLVVNTFGWRFGTVVAVVLLLSAALIAIQGVRAGRRTAEPETESSAELEPATQVTPPEPEVPLAYEIVLDDGEVLPGEGQVLLGRRSGYWPDGSVEPGVTWIADETRTVSRRHVLLDFTGPGAVVVDQRSANGTFITDRYGRTERCEPGVAVPITAEHVVSFGPRWLVLRERADEPRAGSATR